MISMPVHAMPVCALTQLRTDVLTNTQAATTQSLLSSPCPSTFHHSYNPPHHSFDLLSRASFTSCFTSCFTSAPHPPHLHILHTPAVPANSPVTVAFAHTLCVFGLPAPSSPRCSSRLAAYPLALRPVSTGTVGLRSEWPPMRRFHYSATASRGSCRWLCSVCPWRPPCAPGVGSTTLRSTTLPTSGRATLCGSSGRSRQ